MQSNSADDEYPNQQQRARQRRYGDEHGVACPLPAQEARGEEYAAQQQQRIGEQQRHEGVFVQQAGDAPFAVDDEEGERHQRDDDDSRDGGADDDCVDQFIHDNDKPLKNANHSRQ